MFGLSCRGFSGGASSTAERPGPAGASQDQAFEEASEHRFPTVARPEHASVWPTRRPACVDGYERASHRVAPRATLIPAVRVAGEAESFANGASLGVRVASADPLPRRGTNGGDDMTRLTQIAIDLRPGGPRPVGVAGRSSRRQRSVRGVCWRRAGRRNDSRADGGTPRGPRGGPIPAVRLRARPGDFHRPTLRTLMLVTALAVCSPPALKSQEVVHLSPSQHELFSEGRVAAVRGTAQGLGHFFRVNDLSVVEPVSVTVFASNKDDDLLLGLFKEEWTSTSELQRMFAHDAIRVDSTKGKGHHSFTFHVQGDVGIRVEPASDEAAAYELVVWVGAEQRPKLAPKVVSRREFKERVSANPTLYSDSLRQEFGSSTSPMLIIIAALLFGILVLVGYFISRAWGPS